MTLVWFIHIAIITWLALQLYRFQKQSNVTGYFWYGIAFKILGGVLFGLYYKVQIDGGDTWKFFESSKMLAQWGTANFSQYVQALAGGIIPDELITVMGYQEQPRALLMAKILSLFTIMTAGNYWLTGFYFSLFSFAGVWTLVVCISAHYENSGKAALAAFVFLPTVLFWGSGISKEALYLGGFGLVAAWFWPYFYHKPKPVEWVAGLAILWLLFNLKYYYIAVLVPVLAATIINSRIILRPHGLLNHLRWLAIFLLLLFGISWLHPNLRPDFVAQVIKSNAELVVQASANSALIDFKTHADASVWMGLNLPWAIFTGLLRPNIGDWGNLYQNLAVLEHLVVGLFLLGFIRSSGGWKYQQWDWLPCLVYVLLLSGLLTLSTPNFGTLVRYKISYFPMFVFLVLYRNRWWDQLVTKLP